MHKYLKIGFLLFAPIVIIFIVNQRLSYKRCFSLADGYERQVIKESLANSGLPQKVYKMREYLQEIDSSFLARRLLYTIRVNNQMLFGMREHESQKEYQATTTLNIVFGSGATTSILFGKDEIISEDLEIERIPDLIKSEYYTLTTLPIPPSKMFDLTYNSDWRNSCIYVEPQINYYLSYLLVLSSLVALIVLLKEAIVFCVMKPKDYFTGR